MTTPNEQSKRDPTAEKRRRSGGVRWFVKAFVSNTSELLQTTALALGLFLVFMSILLLSFPKGSGLPSLYKEWVGASKKNSSLVLSGSDDASRHVALLTEVRRTVKDRPTDAVAWKSAKSGMQLEDRHAIQTLSRSKAAITFPDNSKLELRENSLVVVKRPSRSGSDRAGRSSLVVLSGRVRGSIAPTTLNGGPVDLTAGSATALIRSEGETPAEYTMEVNPDDNTATLSVYSGVAEVKSAGTTQQLRQNQALTIVQDQPLGPPMWVPDPPRPLSPADATTLTWGAVAPRVSFEWSSSADVEAYRFVVARDASFSEVIYDAVVDSPGSVFGNLNSGWYYWKVHAQNGPAVSLPSRTQRLLIVRDSDPPSLRVDMKHGVIDEAEIVVRGVTDPGTEVSIGGHQLSVSSSGEFEHVLDLIQGPNLVVVEAIDQAGNVSYHSQYVNARF